MKDEEKEEEEEEEKKKKKEEEKEEEEEEEEETTRKSRDKFVHSPTSVIKVGIRTATVPDVFRYGCSARTG